MTPAERDTDRENQHTADAPPARSEPTDILAGPDCETLADDKLPPALPLGRRHALPDSGGHLRPPGPPAMHELQSPRPASQAAVHSRDSAAKKLPSIEGYAIQEMIGQGGMGVVFRATDVRLNRQVALKILPGIRQSADAKARFESEARLLAQVNHHGVARIFEIGLSPDGPFIAMEFIDGKTLDRFAEGKPLAPRRAADLVRQLAEALQACHELGIIHRDVKPSNALVNRNGKLKLTDFGLAKLTGEESAQLTRTGDLMGTPSYMAPEQASGVRREFGPPTDVYGAGAVLYELLTGRPPFSAAEPLQTVMLALTSPPVTPRTILPRIPGDLETITLKCLEKSSRHRYPSCRELADDLNRFLRGETIRAKPTPLLRKTAMWVRRHLAISALLAFIAVGLIATVTGFGLHNLALRRELDRTQRLVSEGRRLSSWLLTDFYHILDGREGLTYARSQLAERTQQYLDALRVEVTNNDPLKLSLADSLIRLAALQGRPESGSLGQSEIARQNLNAAADVLDSLDSKDQLPAHILRTVVSLRLGEIYLSKQDPTATSQQLELSQRFFEHYSTQIEPPLRQELELEFLSLQLKHAASLGEYERGDQIAGQLRELGQAMLEKADDPERIAWVASSIAHALFPMLDAQGRAPEMIESLEKQLQQIESMAPPNTLSISGELWVTALHSLLGDAYARDGQWENAAAEFLTVFQAWEQQIQRDSRNHGALFNAGLAQQDLAEAALQMDDLERAAESIDHAKHYLQQYAEQSGHSLEQHPETLDVFAAEATLHYRRDDLDAARTAIQKKIDGLTEPSRSDWQFRRQRCDALAIKGQYDAVAYAAAMDFEGDEIPASYTIAFRAAESSLQEAIDAFQAMQASGALSEQGVGQLQRVRQTLELIRTQHQRVLAAFDQGDRE